MGSVNKVTKTFYFVYFIIAITLTGYCDNNNSPNLSSVLKKIQQKDLEVIEDLFYLLFRHGDFAYTFLGTKPMCTIDFTMHYAQVISKDKKFVMETYLARKGFDTLVKYLHLFPMKNLRLQLHESKKLGEHFSFILINREMCLPIIKKHLHVFQEHCGQKLDAEGVLELISQGTYFHEDIRDTTSLGLLLGYPEKDVFGFSAKLKGSTTSKDTTVLRPCPLALRKNPLTPIKTPYFMTSRDETDLKKIKSKYSLKKYELVQLYYEEDFLNKILEKLL